MIIYLHLNPEQRMLSTIFFINQKRAEQIRQPAKLKLSARLNAICSDLLLSQIPVGQFLQTGIK
jgi:hypothetical protein